MSDWIWLGLTLGAAVAAVGLGLYGHEKDRKRRFSAYADAVVMDVMKCDRAGTRFRAVYEYTLHGNTYRVPGARAASSPRAFRIGEKAVIRCDPHRPTEFIPENGFDKAAAFLAVGILGCAAFAVSVLLGIIYQ